MTGETPVMHTAMPSGHKSGRKERNMTQTNHSWRIATYIIPHGAELVCDNAVRTDRFILGAALIRYEGQYWLCQNYCLYKVDQDEAAAFAANL